MLLKDELQNCQHYIITIIFKYMRATIISQNYIQHKLKKRLNSGNSCHLTVIHNLNIKMRSYYCVGYLLFEYKLLTPIPFRHLRQLLDGTLFFYISMVT
jgi:hypothetical protein